MELGMIGLGRMGANMAERLVRAGHRVVGYDRDPQAVARVRALGVVGVEALADVVAALAPPRAVWLMVPAGEPVDQTIAAVAPHLDRGGVIVGGGNSNYKDTLHRATALAALGLHLVDVGTSGGIWGLQEGYSLMVGGDEAVVERLRPVLESLAPAPDKGWGRVGPSGAGHFVKMVHNGIEYGLMQSYAEGFALMERKVEFGLDLHRVAEIWRFGSVVRSWILDLTAEALAEHPGLEGIAPYVADSGEGRWTVIEAIELGCPIPVITLALEQRFRSRETSPFAERLLAVLRQRFGGHTSATFPWIIRPATTGRRARRCSLMCRCPRPTSIPCRCRSRTPKLRRERTKPCSAAGFGSKSRPSTWCCWVWGRMGTPHPSSPARPPWRNARDWCWRSRDPTPRATGSP